MIRFVAYLGFRLADFLETARDYVNHRFSWNEFALELSDSSSFTEGDDIRIFDGRFKKTARITHLVNGSEIKVNLVMPLAACLSVAWFLSKAEAIEKVEKFFEDSR